MKTYEIIRALHELGIRLRANEDRTRVVVSREEKRLIPPELGRAIKRNQTDLLCEIILREANRQIYDYITQMHAQPSGSPAYRAAIDAYHGDGRHDRLNDAWFSKDLAAFKAIIREAISAAEIVLHDAIDREERARKEQGEGDPDALPGIPTADHTRGDNDPEPTLALGA